ncbi:MAG: LacI family DNA-binding transcriptional regulator [Candidatus Hydrogenedentes bacterium]|nr:LacI family DNA-binding transcriptional regulator [Candidatus Hydrogenedentota bacterium]
MGSPGASRRGLSGPTLKDIAERAGVSIGTVSAVLNNMPRASRYSEQTRIRVRKIAEELGYAGTPLGRVLRSKASGTLGIISFSQPDIFSSHLMHNAQDEMVELGYQPVTASMHYDQSKFDDCLNQLRRWRVEGMLIMTGGRPLTRHVRAELDESGVPYVAADSSEQQQTLAPRIDNTSGRLAGEHLAELGHRRVAVLGFNRVSVHAHNRLAGLRAGLEQFGATVPESLIVEMHAGSYGGQAGYECAQELVRIGCPTPAAVCMNDLSAFGALRAFADANLGVPDRISVIGFDDISLSAVVSEDNRLGAYTQPRLTTVRLPQPEIGRSLARQLVALVREGTAPASLESALQPTLQVRESTARAGME